MDEVIDLSDSPPSNIRIRKRPRTDMSSKNSEVLQRVLNESKSLANEQIKRQQDEELALSIKNDMAKKANLKAEKQKALQLEKLEKYAAVEKEEQLNRRTENVEKQLPDEPPKGDPNAVELRLSLPSGTENRRFFKGNSVNSLFAWAQVADPRCFSCREFDIVVPPNQRLNSNDLELDGTLEEMNINRCTLRIVIVNE